jgi:hypothetical protein
MICPKKLNVLYFAESGLSLPFFFSNFVLLHILLRLYTI